MLYKCLQGFVLQKIFLNQLSLASMYLEKCMNYTFPESLGYDAIMFGWSLHAVMV